MKKILVADLLRQVSDAMAGPGMGKKAIVNYEGAAFAPIKQYFQEKRTEFYSKQLCDELVLQVHQQYDRGLLGRSKYRGIRKIAALMEEYYQTGTLKWGCLTSRSMRSLTSYFASILTTYVAKRRQAGDIGDKSIKVYESAIKQFLHYLEDLGHKRFGRVTKAVVSAHIPWFAKTRPSGRGPSLFALRSFFRFLNDSGIFPQDWNSVLLDTTMAPRRKIRPGFDLTEAEKILAATDRASSLGKRNYAILLLASRTGLRACDICRIRFADIDWRGHEIKISQHKTGKALTLPLLPDVGNAIADYLLHDRPQVDSSYIFIRSVRPYERLADRSISCMAARYMMAAGIDRKKIARRGFHSFRRSIGVRMLEAEVSMDTVREVLGHSHPDSLKPYLAIERTHLRECALGLSEAGLTLTREELQ